MRISVKQEQFKLTKPFTISRGTRQVASVLTIKIELGDAVGLGECVPYAHYGESMDGVRDAILSLRPPFDRNELQYLLPPGAARNAVDCALWDLEAKQSGTAVWKLAGLESPLPVLTACTVSLDVPSAMRDEAKQLAKFPLLKVKLGGGSGDIERLKAVRAGAPDARLIVDANEGWNERNLDDFAQDMTRLGVEMIEQPLPAASDRCLAKKDYPITVCADESCLGVDSFEKLSNGYGIINIKLDKTGGLTEALALKKLAQSRGYKIMVGCMMGSSLAMAPALLVAQGADVVDLDGPLKLAEDRPVALKYNGAMVVPPSAGLWG